MLIITGAAVVAKSGVTLMARIVGWTAEPITRATLSTIDYAVKNLDDADIAVVTGTLTIASVIYDDLQTDARWTKDSEELPGPDGRWGYNFLTTLAATIFPTGGERYQADVRMTPVTGEPFVVPYQFRPIAVYLS